MKSFNFKRFGLLLKATYLENRKSSLALLAIFTFCVTFIEIIVLTNKVIDKTDNHRASIFELTRDMSEGVIINNVRDNFAMVTFAIIVLVGVIMDRQMKRIRRKHSQSYNALIPATTAEKYTTYVATATITPIIAMTAATYASFLICKAYMWLCYSVTIHFTTALGPAGNNYKPDLSDIISNVIITGLFVLTLFALNIIISIYNATTSKTYVKYLRTVLTIIGVFILIDLASEVNNKDIRKILTHTLLPAITISSWMFSYWVFKKKEIRN